MGKASTRAQNKYIAKAYDRINLTLPKGQKTTLEAAAAECGESVNKYIQTAILARLGLEDWPETSDEQTE